MPRALASAATAQHEDQPPTVVAERWTRVMLVMCLALAAATVVVVVIALEPSASQMPAEVDVVLYQSPQTARMVRYVPQSKAVWKYLPWVRRVFVLSQYALPGWDPSLQVHVVPFIGTVSEAFEFMPSIPEVATHALFLSDMTVPFRPVKKSYLFYQDRPRVFNLFRDQAEVNFLAGYLELPTLPVLATDLHKLQEPPRTWHDLVFRELTEERMVLREDMNRDVFVVGQMLSNVQKQFDKLVSVPPLFATFHIHPQDTDAVTANQTLTQFLSTHFP